MSFILSTNTAAPLQTRSPKDAFVPIPGLNVVMPASPGDTLLVTLCVPDTWNEVAGYGAQFQITRDGVPIAAGNFTGSDARQRIPVFLQAVFIATEHAQLVIEAQWCMNSITVENPNAESHIGSQKATLTVLRSA